MLWLMICDVIYMIKVRDLSNQVGFPEPNSGDIVDVPLLLFR